MMRYMTNRISITEGRKILRESATEAEIQSAIIGYLQTQRIPHSITNAQRSYNHKGQIVRRIQTGWPDITACWPSEGLFLGIEVKTAKGKLKPEQAITLHALYMAGALVVVARSVDDVIQVLQSGKIRGADLLEICRYKDKPVRKRERAT